MPPKPKEFETIFLTSISFELWGIKSIKVALSGSSRFKVGGIIDSWIVFKEISINDKVIVVRKMLSALYSKVKKN